MIFSYSTYYSELHQIDESLKNYLNYNPIHNEYTRKQNIPERNPNETDRGGWRGYDRVYSKYFEQLKNENLNLLEIGIKEGYGLLAWNRYFTNSKIYGVDYHVDDILKNEFEKIKNSFPKYSDVEMSFFDTTDKSSWNIFEDNKFDIIIDDGGHHPVTQLRTLENCWTKLKPGGLFFIEDIGHRYGEVQLFELSRKLEKLGKQGNRIEIFKHFNAGLKRQIESGKISADLDTNCDEYIAVIHKMYK